MIANAILASATIIAISYALSRVLCGRWALAAIVLSCLINAVPVSCDNILMGFNTHFYLLLTFSFASLWLLADSRAWSSRWVAGVLCAVASFLCMASGALTLAAVIGLHLLQIVRDRRGGRREWFGIAALVATTVGLISLVPDVPDLNAYKAHAMRQFLSAFYELASWPSPDILGWIVGLPSALFCLRTILDRPPLSDARWFNVAAFGWILTQFVALAVGRGAAPIANRYFDMLLIGLAINLTSVFWLFGSRSVSGRRKAWRALALAAWLVIVAVSLARPERHLPEYLSYRRQTAEVQAQNLRGISPPGTLHISGAPRGWKSPTSYRAGYASCSTRLRFERRCRRSSCRKIRPGIGSRRSSALSSARAMRGWAPGFSCCRCHRLEREAKYLNGPAGGERPPDSPRASVVS